MIETIMFFGAGFLVAGLLALVLISFVHRRAVRLTLRRLEDAIPVSLAEIQADKDKLRAEFAMSARRLEMTVEQLKAKATSQLGELARKTEAIAKLKAQLAEQTAVADEFDAKIKRLSTFQEYGRAVSMKSAAGETTPRALAANEAALAKAAFEIHELTRTIDTQRVEIALYKTRIEELKLRIDELQHEAQDAARRTAAKSPEEKRQADETWRAESDLLRERIADIAAQVAQMSMDKADSAVAEILKETAGNRPTGFERLANSDDGAPRGGNLTGRIRKLQSAASKVSTAS
jgi:chromosome segregation ATPase